MKHTVLFIGIAAILMNGSCASQHPSNKFGVLSPVEQSIRTWQTENSIALSKEAFNLLVRQAGEDCGNCTTTYHFSPAGQSNGSSVHASSTAGGKEPAKGAPASPSQQTAQYVTPPPSEIRYALYDYYLDQLRDLKMKKGKKPVIEAADILEYSFTSFLRDMRLDNGSMGRLIVQSKPATAQITINGKRKGFTNKRFVVEAGSHRVEITEPTFKLACDVLIRVNEFETKTVVCEPSNR